MIKLSRIKVIDQSKNERNSQENIQNVKTNYEHLIAKNVFIFQCFLE